MAARNRTTVYQRVSGGRWFNNNPGVIIGAGAIGTDPATCGDITGPGDCAPFTVNRRSTDGGVINKYDTGGFSSQFRDYIADWVRNTSNGPHLSVSGIPSDVEMATSAAARTNPSASVVDVPVNILDIRPGVDRIRRMGNDLAGVIRRTGGRWLEYKFATQPLVSDVVKMFYIQDQIDRRVEAINKLYTGRGIRRTVSNGSYSTGSTSSATVQSAGTTINRTFDRFTEVTCKTHIRWKPTSRCGLRPLPSDIRASAARAVRGLTIDFSTLWEILPWSWLADYFGNVGTFLQASRNIIPARVTGVHPMKHTKTIWVCPQYTNGNVTMTSITVHRETKTRSTSFVAPYAHLQFLNGNQMGILSALAAARFR